MLWIKNVQSVKKLIPHLMLNQNIAVAHAPRKAAKNKPAPSQEFFGLFFKTFTHPRIAFIVTKIFPTKKKGAYALPVMTMLVLKLVIPLMLDETCKVSVAVATWPGAKVVPA